MIHGVGVDIVDVERFKKAAKKRGEGFYRRLFTGVELDYCMSKRFPERHLAARFAAKVSLFKATGKRLRFREVEVANSPDGTPFLRVLDGGPVGVDYRLTLSHTGRLAVACIIVEGEDEGR